MMRSLLPAMLLWALPLPAQDPVRGDQGAARAERLLRSHGKNSRAVKVLVADYVQRRTTALSKKPLVSSGAFQFARDPALLMFRVGKPRTAVITLSLEHYQVFRPKRKRLERFVLEGPELARGLFSVLGGDTEKLLADFAIRSCEELLDEKTGRRRARLRLAPRKDAVKAYVQELRVTLDLGKSPDEVVGLGAVAYRDRAGDLVEIELRNVKADPSGVPRPKFDVPAGTKVVEHAPPKRGKRAK